MGTTEAELVHDAPVALAKVERSAVLLTPVMDVRTAMVRLTEFQAFCSEYLTESNDGGNDGGDYGVIPGTKKKTLLKSGSDKLCEVYGLYDEYAVISSVEDWERGLFDYTLKCLLKSRRDDSVVGTGVGSCSSFEAKYRWRDSQRLCPACGKSAIIKGREDYGGGWLCFKKKDGCSAKFKNGDPSIESQTVGRIENPDIIDSKNTVLKMAKKRAKIDAVIGATRSSGIFTQDLEDLTPAKPSGYVVEAPASPVRAAHPPTGEEREKPDAATVETRRTSSDEGPDHGVDMPAGARRIVKVTPGAFGAKGFVELNEKVEGDEAEYPIYSDQLKALSEELCQTGEPVFVQCKQAQSSKKWRIESIMRVPKDYDPTADAPAAEPVNASDIGF